VTDKLAEGGHQLTNYHLVGVKCRDFGEKAAV
jgi:hypothetical protein